MFPLVLDYLTTSHPFRISLAKRQLQWLFLLRVIILTLLLGISVFFQTKGDVLHIPPLKYIISFIGGVYLFTIGSAVILNLIKKFRRFSYIQLLVDSVLSSCLIFFTGGSQSIFTILYFLPIVTAGIMLFRTGSFFLAAVTTLEYGAILILAIIPHPIFLGRYWPDPLANNLVMMHHFAVYGISFFLVAGLSSILSARLQKTEEVLTQTTRNYDRLLLLYKQIFDDIDTGIITVDIQGRITSFNRAAELISGYKAAEVMNQLLCRLFPNLETKEKVAIHTAIELQRRDGATIPVGYSWTRLNMPEGCEDSRVYTLQDLSQIKEMEGKVKQAEKMATIGHMAAGIAHEFRNPIAAISGAAQVLRNEYSREPGNQGLINIIMRESKRLEGTISDFLLFSKPAKPEKKWVSLASQIDETLFLLRQSRDWHEGCSITTSIPAQLDCWADPHQLTQVLLNLTQNACHALEDQEDQEDGHITVSASEDKTVDGHEAIIIRITDNGPGIPAHIRPSIFEPFFTTRDTGTGLGLAIVKQIVESHGGEIQVFEAEKGQGTTFSVSLPLP